MLHSNNIAGLHDGESMKNEKRGIVKLKQEKMRIKIWHIQNIKH